VLRRRELPKELSKLVQIPMHPEIHKELKIAALRDDTESVAFWVHQHLCQVLNREDLTLQVPVTYSSAK
jgi:predicted HicB family RNase H-like nuclease